MAHVGGLSLSDFMQIQKTSLKAPLEQTIGCLCPDWAYMMMVFSSGIGPEGQGVPHHMLHLALWNPDTGTGLVQDRMWHMLSRNHTHALPS